jgi:hypothetical protein
MWDNLVKVTESLYRGVVSEQDLDYGQDCLVAFQEQFEELFLPEEVMFNQHYAFHLADCIEDLGSFYVFHCFGNERFIGLVMSVHNDNRHPQMTVMLAWTDYQDLTFWESLNNSCVLSEDAKQLRNLICGTAQPRVTEHAVALNEGYEPGYDYEGHWYKYALQGTHSTGCEPIPGFLRNPTRVPINEPVRGAVRNFLRERGYRNQGETRVGGTGQCTAYARLEMFGTVFGSAKWNRGAGADVMVRFTTGLRGEWYWYIGQVQQYLRVPVSVCGLRPVDHYFAQVEWYRFRNDTPGDTIAEIRILADFEESPTDPIIPVHRIACGCIRLPCRENGVYQVSALPDLLSYTHLDDPFDFNDEN